MNQKEGHKKRKKSESSCIFETNHKKEQQKIPMKAKNIKTETKSEAKSSKSSKETIPILHAETTKVIFNLNNLTFQSSKNFLEDFPLLEQDSSHYGKEFFEWMIAPMKA